jgi:serine/threonine protein kinase
MAYDIQEKKNVALKIMVSGSTAENKYIMRQEIVQTVRNISNLLTYSDTFLVRGSDFDHRVREKVYLADFGHAIKAGTSVCKKWQWPIIYCSPERFHNVDPSCASDMWSYMCLFTELYTGATPFDVNGWFR